MSKPKSEETKMSLVKGGGTIYVYDSQGTLVNTYCSARRLNLLIVVIKL